MIEACKNSVRQVDEPADGRAVRERVLNVWDRCPPFRTDDLMTTYLIYIDDSGDEHHDVLAAFCIPVETWGPVIGYWKAFRKQMNRQWGVPPSVEFHSQELLRRRSSTLLDHVKMENGQPKEYEYPQQIELPGGQVMTREELFIGAVTRLAEMNTGDRSFGVRVLATHAPAANGMSFLHEPLMELLHAFLVDDDSWAVLWVDGTDTHREERLRGHHRAPPAKSRRILEDAIPRRSTHSHLIQIADICAHAALRHIRATDGQEPRKLLGSAFSRLNGLLIQPEPPYDGGYQGIHEIAVQNE